MKLESKTIGNRYPGRVRYGPLRTYLNEKVLQIDDKAVTLVRGHENDENSLYLKNKKRKAKKIKQTKNYEDIDGIRGELLQEDENKHVYMSVN